MLRIGVDLGGTKIEAVALRAGAEIRRLRTPTPRDDYRATLEAITGLVDAIEADTRERGTVGVGIPGTLSAASGLVKNANSTWLIGRPLRDDLSARLGREVRVANDANCFAVSEATDGAAAGMPVVFAVIIGTGAGAGIVVNGALVTGPNGIAGEWGHTPLPWADPDEQPGPPCYCGRSGCNETFLSGPGLERDHRKRGGPSLAAEAIVARAVSGEAVAEQALARYERRMAKALAVIINVIDPDVIVLGGGLSNIERLYDTVPRLWSAYVFGASPGEPVRTRLVRAMHGAASGVRGAAWLWP